MTVSARFVTDSARIVTDSAKFRFRADEAIDFGRFLGDEPSAFSNLCHSFSDSFSPFSVRCRRVSGIVPSILAECVNRHLPAAADVHESTKPLMDDTSRIGPELANFCKVNPSMLTAKDGLSESRI